MLVDASRPGWFPRERRRRPRPGRSAEAAPLIAGATATPGRALALVTGRRRRDAGTARALQAYLQTRSRPDVRTTLDVEL